MAQKIRKFNFRSIKRRGAGNKELQVGGEDGQCQQDGKFRRLQNFRNLRNPQAYFCSPKTEHLQQHKPKNYEKLSLKNKKIYKIWKLQDLNTNPKLKIEIKQNKNLIKIFSGFQVPARTTPCDAEKGSHGGSRRRSSSMLVVRCAVVESNFCSWLSIILFVGVGGMKDAGKLTDAVDPSSSASWFSINSSCSL